jgi:hypothetical protein
LDVAVLVRNCLLFRPLVPDAAFQTVARAAEQTLPVLEAAIERCSTTPVSWLASARS